LFWWEDLNSIIYLDESGDLGWNFSAPYRGGGSSRYLTITALCVPSEKSHFPKRAIKHLYEKFKWPTSCETKWAGMTNDEKSAFAAIALKMCEDHTDIHLHAIVVKKENVEDHIRRDGNKLYNYMIYLSLIERMCAYEQVTMIPDPRSIKVKSGNSLHDYLQTELWFTKKVKTQLSTRPVDSKSCRGIQFADMLAGLVQGKFENGDNRHLAIVRPKLKLNCLFF
jgi:hypothetical protein